MSRITQYVVVACVQCCLLSMAFSSKSVLHPFDGLVIRKTTHWPTQHWWTIGLHLFPECYEQFCHRYSPAGFCVDTQLHFSWVILSRTDGSYGHSTLDHWRSCQFSKAAASCCILTLILSECAVGELSVHSTDQIQANVTLFSCRRLEGIFSSYGNETQLWAFSEPCILACLQGHQLQRREWQRSTWSDLCGFMCTFDTRPLSKRRVQGEGSLPLGSPTPATSPVPVIFPSSRHPLSKPVVV